MAHGAHAADGLAKVLDGALRVGERVRRVERLLVGPLDAVEGGSAGGDGHVLLEDGGGGLVGVVRVVPLAEELKKGSEKGGKGRKRMGKWQKKKEMVTK